MNLQYYEDQQEHAVVAVAYDGDRLLRLGERMLDRLERQLCHAQTVVRGVAKCHPDDRFSKQEGRALARDRAVRKSSQAQLRLGKSMLKELREQERLLEEFCDHHKNQIQRAEDRLAARHL